MTPGYSSAILAWAEAGGVYAIAGLRGGSEEGEEWHRAGMRERKQNVFDDLDAAALALMLLGPVIVNILFFDTFLDGSGLPLGIVLAVLALFLLGRHRQSFAGLLEKQSPATKKTTAETPYPIPGK